MHEDGNKQPKKKSEEKKKKQRKGPLPPPPPPLPPPPLPPLHPPTHTPFHPPHPLSTPGSPHRRSSLPDLATIYLSHPTISGPQNLPQLCSSRSVTSSISRP